MNIQRSPYWPTIFSDWLPVTVDIRPSCSLLRIYHLHGCSQKFSFPSRLFDLKWNVRNFLLSLQSEKKCLQLIQFCSPDESVGNFLHVFLNIVTYIYIPMRLKRCTDDSQTAERGFVMWRGLRHSAENPSRALAFPRESRDSNQLSPISLKWFVWPLPKAQDGFVGSRLDPVGESLSWKLTSSSQLGSLLSFTD